MPKRTKKPKKILAELKNLHQRQCQQQEEPQCETGCMTFYGGEIRHHKDCAFYKDSLSEKYNRQNEELATKDQRIAELEVIIRQNEINSNELADRSQEAAHYNWLDDQNEKLVSERDSLRTQVDKEKQAHAKTVCEVMDLMGLKIENEKRISALEVQLGDARKIITDVAKETSHDCFETEYLGESHSGPQYENTPNGKDCYLCELNKFLSRTLDSAGKEVAAKEKKIEELLAENKSNVDINWKLAEQLTKLEEKRLTLEAQLGESRELLTEIQGDDDYYYDFVSGFLLRLPDTIGKEVETMRNVCKAAKLVSIQNFGMRNAWAGLYQQCKQHGSWAYGGNWEARADSCPWCELTSALDALREAQSTANPSNYYDKKLDDLSNYNAELQMELSDAKIERDATKTRLARLEDQLVEAMAELIYLRLYGKNGAVWEANETKYVWREKAQKALSLSPKSLDKEFEAMRKVCEVAQSAHDRGYMNGLSELDAALNTLLKIRKKNLRVRS